MGKVLASGHAEQEFTPDVCQISIGVYTSGATAAKAALDARAEFEKLLSALSGLGIQPENMTITDDCTLKPSYRNEKNYTSERSLSLHMPINAALANQIHGIVASGFENVTIRIRHDVSTRSEHLRALTRQAILDSRRTAELLTEATGGRIIGIEAANLDGGSNMDIEDLDLNILEAGEEDPHCLCCSSPSVTPFADRLNPEKVTLKADVKVVWRISDD